jgi:hypothetical protein
MFGPATDWEEPTMRYSNLLPVKAMGLVRLRSVRSLGSSGRAVMPIFTYWLLPLAQLPSFVMASRIEESCSPR